MTAIQKELEVTCSQLLIGRKITDLLEEYLALGCLMPTDRQDVENALATIHYAQMNLGISRDALRRRLLQGEQKESA